MSMSVISVRKINQFDFFVYVVDKMTAKALALAVVLVALQSADAKR
jgi:hypothetical protein